MHSTLHSTLPKNALSQVELYLQQLQQSLCKRFEVIDGEATFIEDRWTRAEGGGGRSCVIQKGKVFEKLGVNFSHVSGETLPPSASASRPQITGRRFHALGVSIVAHPQNPFAPTAHANVRFFIAEKEGEPAVWWFGGGFDLTPYYGFDEDCIHWHATALKACQPFGEHLYPSFKSQCDSYFYITHRNEPRGIGGLFFDDFNEHGFTHSFGLMQSIGNHFIQAYEPIVQRRKNTLYTAKHKAFQCYRRGRYVEFNLVYDRGTLFGLQSNGRTESILVSLPPEVYWEYLRPIEPGSDEEALYKNYLVVRQWV